MSIINVLSLFVMMVMVIVFVLAGEILGLGMFQPQIVVTPDSLDADLMIGETSTQIMTISNTGDSDLVFNISVIDQSSWVEDFSVFDSEQYHIQDTGNSTYWDELDNQFVLTKAESFKSGRIFYKVPFLMEKWTADFDFRMGGGGGGDGLTFAFCENYQYESVIGGKLDFWDASGFAVEFDAFRNYAFYDPSEEHFAILQNYANNHLSYEIANNGEFENNEWHHARVVFNQGQIILFLDGEQKIDYTMPNYEPFEGFFGFTAATGGNNNWHIIDNIVISNVVWLTTNLVTGTVPANSSIDVEVIFDATSLNGGDYLADLTIASNDPDNSMVTIPAHMHVTGIPDITVSDNLFDFGSLFIGAAVVDTLVIANVGTDKLLINNISTDNSDYTADITAFSLEPGESQEVQLTFAPSSGGTISGTLTIESNDQDEPAIAVALQGIGIVPADISVSADSLDADLLYGETSTQVFTISNINEGGIDLVFNILIEEADMITRSGNGKTNELNRTRDDDWIQQILQANEDIAKNFNSPLPEAGEDQIPNFEKTEILSAEEIMNSRQQKSSSRTGVIYAVVLDGWGTWNSGYTVYDELNADWSNYGDNEILIDYSTLHDVEITYEALAATGADILIISDNYNANYSFTAAEAMAIAQYVNEGVGLYISSGTFNNGNYSQTQPQVDYLAPLVGLSNTETYYWATSSYQPLDFVIPEHPVLLNIPEPYISDYSYNCYPSGGIWTPSAYPDGELVGISNDSKKVVIVKGNRVYNSSLPEVYYGNESDKQFFYNAITLLGVSWLSLTPDAGTIPSGSSLDIEVTFDAVDLYGGDYNANIVITSNDPDESVVTIPAHLHITGEPDITVSDTLLDFDSLFVGTATIDTLTIANVGSDLLLISNISVDNTDFMISSPIFSLNPEESQELLITFTPSSAGIITAALTIESNDPDEGVITVTLQGEGLVPPEISVSPDSLDAELLTGGTTTQMFTIYNNGGSSLFWEIFAQFAENSVVQSSPRFTSLDFIIEDKEIHIDPPDRPDRSEIYAFNISDRMIDNIQKYSNVEKNSSQLSRQSITSLEDILQNLNAKFDSVINVIPNRYDFSNGETGYYIYDGGNDMYDNGNILSTDLGGYIYYSNDVIVNSIDFGTNGRYFTRKYPGLFVLVADMQGVEYFQINGNLGADGYGNANGAILQTQVGGITYYGFVKRVYNAGDPSVNHLIIVEEYSMANHEFSTNTNDDYHRVFNLQGSERIYYLLYAGANGYYIDNNETLNIMNKFLLSLKLAPGWISMDPASGTLGAGSSMDIEVTFDAFGLATDDYYANIVVASNDPINPEDTVSAHLYVTGAPDIAVSDTLIDFDSLFIGAILTDTLVITNEGTDILTVSDISSDNTNYTIDINTFSLNPNESQEILVTFTPSSEGTISGALTIENDDFDESVIIVDLQGVGVVPPDISVSPDSLDVDLNTGETSTQLFTISNNGVYDLFFDISTKISDVVTMSAKGKTDVLKGFHLASEGMETNLDISELNRTRDDNWILQILQANEQTARSITAPMPERENAQLPDLEQIQIMSADEIMNNRQQKSSPWPGVIYAVVLDGWGTWNSGYTTYDELNANWPNYGDNEILIDYSTLHNVEITYEALVATGADVLIISNNYYPYSGYGAFTAVEAMSIAQYVDEGAGLYISAGTFNNGNFSQLQAQVDYLTPLVGLSNTETYYWATSSYQPLDFVIPDHPVLQDIPEPYISGYQYNCYPSGGTWTPSTYPDGELVGISNDTRKVVIANGNRVYNSSIPEYYVGNESDKQFFYNVITLSGVTWLSLDPTSGTILSGSSMDIEVTFDPGNLVTDNYNAYIIITSNDLDEPEDTVFAHLHVTGAPDIAVSESLIDFDSLFIGKVLTDTLIISNEGTDVLSVTNILSNNTDYTVDITSFSLNPGEDQEVLVTFTPGSAGEITGILSIESNDQDESTVTVTLQGMGVEPPDILVTPMSINEALFPGDSSMQVLTITNNGVYDLTFEINIQTQNKTLPSAPVPITDTWVAKSTPQKVLTLAPEEDPGEPNDYTPSEPREITSSLIFGDNFEDGDYDGWIDHGDYGIKEVTSATAANGTIYSYHEYNSPYGHYDGIYQELGGVQPGYVSFYIRSGATNTHDANFVLRHSSGYGGIFFFARGSGYLYVNADVGGDQTFAYTAETWYHIEFKNIDFNTKTFDYYVNEALIKPNISFRWANYVTDFDRLEIYNFSSGSQAWWDEFIIATEEGPIWITTDPSSGTISSGSSMDIEVTFNAADLEECNYSANIIINCNDPDDSITTVPVNLHILNNPEPLTIIDPDTLFMFQAYTLQPESAMVYIGDFVDGHIPSNIDPSTLLINDSIVASEWLLLPSHPDFYCEVLSFKVPLHGFILGYGFQYDTTIQTYTVSGEYTDGTSFTLAGAFTLMGHVTGDINADGSVDISDLTYFVSYFYNDGPAPLPEQSGDINRDGQVDIGDLVAMVEMMF